MIDYYINRHESFLEQIIKNSLIPSANIRQALNYSMFPGGKRIRPVLVYLIGELIEVDLTILDVIAASIELTHCYSLIHDDLPAMDNDDFRRGKLSCHKAFDEATAILVGDGLQALAIELLLSMTSPLLEPQQILKITYELVKASGFSGMVSGQGLDLYELSNPEINEEQLKEIHLLKTGKLIKACLDMVLAAKKTVDSDLKEALTSYIEHIGLVFQMQDDYLDRYAPTEVLGKKRSSDLANNKATFASLYTQEQLAKLINSHYKNAFNELQLFGAKANQLLELTRKLENRTTLE